MKPNFSLSSTETEFWKTRFGLVEKEAEFRPKFGIRSNFRNSFVPYAPRMLIGCSLDAQRIPRSMKIAGWMCVGSVLGAHWMPIECVLDACWMCAGCMIAAAVVTLWFLRYCCAIVM